MGIELASSFDRKAGVPLDSLSRVANIAERDAIPALVRYVGMEVTVLDDGTGLQKKYWLKYGIENSDWSDDVGGGGSGSGVIQAADIAARDAIATDQRQEGLLVYVFSAGTEPKTFQLVGGISNAHWKEVVTQDSSTAIKNKDIDGGTASDTSRITVPRAATIETAAALVRKKATLLYNDFTNKFLKDNGTDLKSIPDFGDVNIFAQEIAEDNVIGSWTQNLSGITATFTKGTDSRLGTCYKLDITSAPSGTGGTYTVRKDFAVPERVRGTFVELSYDYVSTVSKTGTCVMVYDVTNSTMIVPQTEIQAQPDPTSLTTKGFITFSIPSTCATLRVFIGRAVDASAIAISNQYFYFNNLQFKKFTQAIAITEGPKSHIRFGNGGNRGSTNTQVVHFTELAEQSGTGLTYVNTAALGTEIRVLRSGVLVVTSTRNQPVGAVGAQIVKNATTFSTSHPTGTVIAGYVGSSGAGVQTQMSGSTRVVAGDIIRFVAENNTSTVDIRNTFSAVLHEDNLAARYADYTLNQDVYLYASGTISTSMATATEVKIPYSTTTSLDDQNSILDLTSQRVIAKTSGTYVAKFKYIFTSPNNSNGRIISLLKRNGSFLDESFNFNTPSSSSASMGYVVSRPFKMNVGDYIECFGNQSTGSTVTASSSEFTLVKLETSQQLFTPINVEVGIAQNYVDVTASRASGVTYTNNTSRPIMVHLSGTSNTSADYFGDVTVGGVVISIGQGTSQGTAGPYRISLPPFMVPPAKTYSVIINSIESLKWVELR